MRIQHDVSLMTAPTNISPNGAGRMQGSGAAWPLVRWLLSYSTFSVPQAAGPIAFALLALPLTGDPRSGAAIVLAITIAQVVGAVPIARFGQRRNSVFFLKALVVIRTLALAILAVLAAVGASFTLLLMAAALAGLVNGAAFGYLRSVLNHLVEPSRMPRALGLAATVSEVTFVSAPVLASFLGTINPVFALLFLTMLGATTVLLVPNIPNAKAPAPVVESGSLLTPAIIVWLGGALANSTVVSSIEVGAVSLATKYGFEPAQGFIFTVCLCVASVAGGVWVSTRNRVPRHSTIMAYLIAISTGATLIAADLSVEATLVGAVMVGAVLAPLNTSYSLQLDALSPTHRRAEVFALSRTATSIGIIITSTTLTLTSLAITQAVTATVVCMVAAAVGIALIQSRKAGT